MQNRTVQYNINKLMVKQTKQRKRHSLYILISDQIKKIKVY